MSNKYQRCLYRISDDLDELDKAWRNSSDADIKCLEELIIENKILEESLELQSKYLRRALRKCYKLLHNADVQISVENLIKEAKEQVKKNYILEDK